MLSVGCTDTRGLVSCYPWDVQLSVGRTVIGSCVTFFTSTTSVMGCVRCSTDFVVNYKIYGFSSQNGVYAFSILVKTLRTNFQRTEKSTF